MHLTRYSLRGFRRLENVEIQLQPKDTIFVGANNAGKTSATEAFRLFISQEREIRIHDFSSPLFVVFDEIGRKGKAALNDTRLYFPSIEMDLWFTIDDDIEYGKIGEFLPRFFGSYTEVGVRVAFSVTDPDSLINEFLSAKRGPNIKSESTARRTLSEFLDLDSNLKQHYALKYYKLEQIKNEAGNLVDIAHPLDKEKGRKGIKSLVLVDYIEAQRNLSDNNSKENNRLSKVFGDFYKSNLKQAEMSASSVDVINESNDNLTKHYASEFHKLLDVIGTLGFPALNDRTLRVVSTLNAESALSGNTALKYVEKQTEHVLPEAYNGLGFKNLIYLSIQMAHFIYQWAAIEEDRPLCHLIFIEEPEVHLHAQVQQSFIRNIRTVVEKIVADTPGPRTNHQLVITTHSSHIVAETDFSAIRYFRRIGTKIANPTTFTPIFNTSARNPTRPSIPLIAEPNNIIFQIRQLFSGQSIIASQVLNLETFNEQFKADENLQFLKKYMRLTHCDLFFADAAILVEGAVERTLLPMMIRNTAPGLVSKYLSILELGGAFAHRIQMLLKFINLPTLLITDLDSVKPTKPRKICKAIDEGAETCNQSLVEILKVRSVSDLIALPAEKRTVNIGDWKMHVAYQTPVSVPKYGVGLEMAPRTFEDSFIFTNIEKVRKKMLDVLIKVPKVRDFENDYELIHKRVSSRNFKKVEFALNQLFTETNWITPSYVEDGLKWLETALGVNSPINAPVEAKPNTEEE